MGRGLVATREAFLGKRDNKVSESAVFFSLRAVFVSEVNSILSVLGGKKYVRCCCCITPTAFFAVFKNSFLSFSLQFVICASVSKYFFLRPESYSCVVQITFAQGALQAASGATRLVFFQIRL